MTGAGAPDPLPPQSPDTPPGTPAPDRTSSPAPSSSITVAVVSICGASHLSRCLAALDAQEEAPPFDLLVVYDPHLEDVAALGAIRPDVRFVANEGQRTPLELASRAVHEAGGELVILTEDHCIPRPDWVRRLVEAQRPDRAAVGGSVDALPGATSLDWAFYLVDFFRYMPPLGAGPSPSLTVCNVSYRRDRLDAIGDLWREIFHETAINDALRSRFGQLWLEPNAAVAMRRHVGFRDAVYERYAFGRLFGCTRLEFSPAWRRAYYVLLAPTLPVLLLTRMALRSLASARARVRFVRSFPHLVALVLAWSWGEWLGYLTRRRPRSELVAQELGESIEVEKDVSAETST